jgi:hypothetical protein
MGEEKGGRKANIQSQAVVGSREEVTQNLTKRGDFHGNT